MTDTIYSRLIQSPVGDPLRGALLALLSRANEAGKFVHPTNEEAASLILDALEPA